MTDTPTPTTSVDAVVADATNVQGYPFEFGGVTYRARPQFDARIFVHLERGNVEKALNMLLGKEQTEELMNADTDEVFTGDMLSGILEQAAKYQGSTVGESTASTSFS